MRHLEIFFLMVEEKPIEDIFHLEIFTIHTYLYLVYIIICINGSLTNPIEIGIIIDNIPIPTNIQQNIIAKR